MRKFLLSTTMIVCCAMFSFAQNVTYVLPSGAQMNPYGWTGKTGATNSILAAFTADWNALASATRTWHVDGVATQIQVHTGGAGHDVLFVNLMTQPRWVWLRNYVVHVASGQIGTGVSQTAFNALNTNTHGNLRVAIDNFFFNHFMAPMAWNGGGDFRDGQGTFQQFRSHWIHGFSTTETRADIGTNALPIPYQADYVFVGWFTESGGEGTQYTHLPAGDGDVTLYAHFQQIINCPIEYNLNGGAKNRHNWVSKEDMWQAFLVDFPNPVGGSGASGTLAHYRNTISAGWGDAASAPYRGIGLLIHPINFEDFFATNEEEWGWLRDYIISVVGGTPNWRPELIAFWLEAAYGALPLDNTDFSVAGTPEAFQPAWGYSFPGPTVFTGTPITLPVPFKDGYVFDGWCVVGDGSEFVTEIYDCQADGTPIEKFAMFSLAQTVNIPEYRAENAIVNMFVDESNVVRLCREVAHISVFNTTGQLLTVGINSNMIHIPATGVFLVKAITHDGQTVVQRVIMR